MSALPAEEGPLRAHLALRIVHYGTPIALLCIFVIASLLSSAARPPAAGPKRAPPKQTGTPPERERLLATAHGRQAGSRYTFAQEPRKFLAIVIIAVVACYVRLWPRQSMG